MVEQRVGYQLKRAQHLLRLATDAALRPLGLTTPQYATLSAIAEVPGASSAALARRAFVTPQTMNEIVRGLVSVGLLARQAHPEHGRVIQLYLTPSGEAALGEAHARVDAVEARMLGGLKPEQATALASWLRRCADRLDASEPSSPAGPP
jgi:DNA-binding MarR family transcriptional regulator